MDLHSRDVDRKAERCSFVLLGGGATMSKEARNLGNRKSKVFEHLCHNARIAVCYVKGRDRSVHRADNKAIGMR